MAYRGGCGILVIMLTDWRCYVGRMQEQVPALRMIGLYKAFRETVAVDHVDLTVPSGSFSAWSLLRGR